jgi:uncharacterized protein YfaS (alpha-2-macroglobulin family)
MVSVRVYSKSTGKAVKGAKVSLGKDGFFTGGVTQSQYTDSSGEAHFNTDSGSGRVFVDGKTLYEGRLSGMVTVYK